MADFKNYDSESARNDLKNADAEKSGGSTAPRSPLDLGGDKMTAFAMSKGIGRSGHKKLPIIIDIVIAVLILAIAAGAVAGAYFAFRYFSNDYEGIEIQYTFIKLGDTGSLVRYRSLKNSDVYIDSEDNTHYMGRVVSCEVIDVEPENGISMLVLSIRSNAKYQRGEGYSVGNYKIAVGADYTIRSAGLSVDGTIVAFNENGEASAVNEAENESGTDESESEAEN